MAFNSKNLTYESQEPAFLRKLRYDSNRSDSGRQERPIARPHNHTRSGEQDDEPLYVVDGTHETLSRENFHALIKDVQGDKHQEQLSANNEGPQASQTRDSTTSKRGEGLEGPIPTIGITPKRRPARIIGNEDEKLDNQDGISAVKNNKYPQKSGRKSKKVKLSFQEDADGL